MPAAARASDIAYAMDMNLRSVYRWVHARIVTAECDGWVARFAIRPEEDSVRASPVQIEEWRRVE